MYSAKMATLIETPVPLLILSQETMYNETVMVNICLFQSYNKVIVLGSFVFLLQQWLYLFILFFICFVV